MNSAPSRTFPIIIEKDEDGFYVAINSSLPGCTSQGKSIEEALANIQEATELYLEAAVENGQEIFADTDVSVHLISA